MLLALVNIYELIVSILSIKWEEEEEANLFRKLMACQYPHLGI